MPNPNDKHPENIPGPWYVDSSCISCGLCGEYAPATFRESSDGSQHIVHHQPTTDAERTAAHESMEGCPVDAIGDNS